MVTRHEIKVKIYSDLIRRSKGLGPLLLKEKYYIFLRLKSVSSYTFFALGGLYYIRGKVGIIGLEFQRTVSRIHINGFWICASEEENCGDLLTSITAHTLISIWSMILILHLQRTSFFSLRIMTVFFIKACISS
jgi:hypothetical protein